MSHSPAPPDPDLNPRNIEQIRRALFAQITPAAPDELLLAELACDAAALSFRVQFSTEQLALILPQVLEDSRRAVAVSRALAELAALGNALAKRVALTLESAAALRTHRRLR